MTQEQAAAAAMHAAKIAQLGAMGHNLEKLQPGLLPPQFDLNKIDQQNQNDNQNKILSTSNVTIEAMPKFNMSSQNASIDRIDIRRDSSEPMDLGHENDNTIRDGNNDRSSTNLNDGGTSSGDDANYSDEDGGGNS